MQEKNETVTEVNETETSERVVRETVEEERKEVAVSKQGNLVTYLVVGALLFVITLALVFFMEREGRIATGIFSGIIASWEERKPVATVNGVEILRRDFDSSFNQMLQMSADQGVDVTDPEVIEQHRTQAMETLINGELLRQAAVEAGYSVTEEEITTRYNEIRDGIGGATELATRMAEINVTEETLRRDIKNEILIQRLFESQLPSAGKEVTEAEVQALYDQIGGGADGVPPLADVYQQVVDQIRFNRQQAEIYPYLETLRTEATIEILI